MRIQFKDSALAAIVAAAGVLGSSVYAAPLSYTGGAISNNFDSLPTNVTNAFQVISGQGPHEFSAVNAVSPASAVDGWQLRNNGGSGADTEFRSQNGSLSGSGGRGVESFGTDGSGERALGALPTSAQLPVFGLVLKNDSATAFSSVTISFTGEQWRHGDRTSDPNILTFAYGVGAASIASSLTSLGALSFASPVQTGPINVNLDGNLPANQVAKSSTINGLNWLPGQQLVLRWTINEASGQDDGLGIDNFNMSAVAVPEPSTWALAAMACLAMTRLFARRRGN